MSKETIKELKPIILRDEETGRVYTLRFTRATVRKLEQQGFDVNDIDKHPMTRIPEIFYGAFLAEHPYIKRSETDDILFNRLGGMSDAMLERLGELYAEPFNTLIATEDDSKNPRTMAVEL